MNKIVSDAYTYMSIGVVDIQFRRFIKAALFYTKRVNPHYPHTRSPPTPNTITVITTVLQFTPDICDDRLFSFTRQSTSQLSAFLT